MKRESSDLKDFQDLVPGNKSLLQEHEVQQVYSDMIFSNQEEQSFHNSYEQELREMKSIELGNLEMLKKCWTEIQPTSYGKLSGNPIRNIKNLCIIIIAFASRAAIRGGVSPELAFSLCDSYIQKVEDSNDSLVLVQLARRAEQRYTELVSELDCPKAYPKISQSSAHVEECKNYIFSHLHEKLTVQNIADEIHINANYLSSVFKKYEGITLLQFILKEKVKLAQNMLIYSNYSYSQIANYLGFSSQSHLNMCFKKITHLTLGEYRNHFSSKNFNVQED